MFSSGRFEENSQFRIQTRDFPPSLPKGWKGVFDEWNRGGENDVEWK